MEHNTLGFLHTNLQNRPSGRDGSGVAVKGWRGWAGGRRGMTFNGPGEEVSFRMGIY